MAIVFVGFMGAGKTSAARAAGGRGGLEPVDSDLELERRAGRPIAELFADEGEAGFRAREEEVVLDVLARAAPGQPVALGGGALGSARVRDALRAHTVAYLEVDERTAWSRARRNGRRPLARDRAAFSRLLRERVPVYEAVADAFLRQGDLPGALDALRALRPGTRLLWGRGHPVWVGDDAWPPTGERDAVITDANVRAHHGERMRGLTLTVEPGEEHKTLASAERLWRALAAAGVDRDWRVVAVGGGVVGDLAGFVAATYQRGIPVVQVPTTLVAQVDAALGGKTGVDLPEGKNYVGAFHQPVAVHVVPATLETLPAAERAAGYAEVLKTALIAGGALWERVARGDDPDGDMVLACARTKLGIVAADERDGGPRQLLNLGHTVGHAIESVTGYARYRHGEAVALGLLAALRLSGRDELRAHVGELLAARGLPVRLDGADPAAVARATRTDKKRRNGEVPFVLVQAPGDVRFGQRVADDDLLAAVAELAR
jgi:shikimate kinase/3-dehydroquinate synthase